MCALLLVGLMGDCDLHLERAIVGLHLCVTTVDAEAVSSAHNVDWDLVFTMFASMYGCFEIFVACLKCILLSCIISQCRSAQYMCMHSSRICTYSALMLSLLWVQIQSRLNLLCNNLVAVHVHAALGCSDTIMYHERRHALFAGAIAVLSRFLSRCMLFLITL